MELRKGSYANNMESGVGICFTYGLKGYHIACLFFSDKNNKNPESIDFSVTILMAQTQKVPPFKWLLYRAVVKCPDFFTHIGISWASQLELLLKPASLRMCARQISDSWGFCLLFNSEIFKRGHHFLIVWIGSGVGGRMRNNKSNLGLGLLASYFKHFFRSYLKP